MVLQTQAEPPIKDAAGGGGGGVVLDVDDHFEGKRGEQTCGGKIRSILWKETERGGGIQSLQLAAGRPSDEGQASSQSHEEVRRRRRSEF